MLTSPFSSPPFPLFLFLAVNQLRESLIFPEEHSSDEGQNLFIFFLPPSALNRLPLPCPFVFLIFPMIDPQSLNVVR